MSQVLCPVLIGRAAELGELRSALERAVAGRGGCVLITGEAGIGKSRLIRELADMAAGLGVTAVGGRAVPTSSSTPYRPLTEALLALLRETPVPDDESLRPWLSHLGALLPGLVAGAGEPGGLAGAETLRGEAVLALLRRVSPGGLVVSIEDLHWADADSLGLLEYLADNASSQRLLLAVSLRGETGTPGADLVRLLRGRPGVVHLGLGRLTEAEAADMVAACQPGLGAAARSRIARVADGVPLLVEELLASPGVPESISDTVRARLGELAAGERAVLETAAVMGRQFDWEILPAASAQSAETVSRALAAAVDRQLVTADDGQFRFRHALTREAVLALMLPPRLSEVAAAALAAVDSAHPYLEGDWREVAADLAARAGQRGRAGRLLAEAGRSSVQVGALATAVETLQRAAALLDPGPERTGAELGLVEALALAGRVDESATAATRLIGRLGDDPATADARMEAHLHLARAAVAASRWALARRHLAAARELAGGGSDPALTSRASVISADVALAAGDLGEARAAAEAVLALGGASADTRCHAYEIVGRTQRLHDLPAASAAFEAALATAERHDLALWRMRALHELGTVDVFERVDGTRLLEARRLAEEMGALSTVAVIDLQLGATFTARWDLEACDAHAGQALETARHLGLHQVAAKALATLAGSASMRADLRATRRWADQALAADPSDPALPGFCRASMGMALLMAGDTAAALGPFAEGAAELNRLAHAEPISIRALWPVVQAALGDPRARDGIDQVRRRGVDAFHLNRGMIGWAQAVLEGRAGRRDRAEATVAGLGSTFAGCEPWADLVRFIAAPAAVADGWGEPRRWLEDARRRFTALGLDALAERCDQLLGAASSNPWAAEGVTAREAEVFHLVIEGRANKEIAAALGLSPRTVEKHVESLLRKTGARSRTEMAVAARRATT